MNNKCNNSNKNNKNSKRKKNTTTAKEKHNRSCLCVPWEGGAAPSSASPCPPRCFYSIVACFRFCPFWFLCVGVNKDHDVHELVNKLRFHNASIIQQNGRLKFKNAAHIICKILQIPCAMQHERVYLPNVADALQN